MQEENLSLFRFRPNTSGQTNDYLIEEIRQAIQGRFFLHPLASQSDIFEAAISRRNATGELSDIFPFYHELMAKGRALRRFGSSRRYNLIEILNPPGLEAKDAPGSEGATAQLMADIIAIGEQNESIPKFLSDFRHNTVTACFSKSLSNPKMWADYAKGHDGVALKFSVFAYEDEASGIVLKEIEYSESSPEVSYPDICLYKFLLLYGIAVHEIDPDFSALSFERAFTQFKSEAFSSEQEWRLLGFDGKTEPYTLFSGLRLDAIYLGANLDAARGDEIIREFGKRAAIFRMNRAAAGYRFTIVKLKWHDDDTYEWELAR